MIWVLWLVIAGGLIIAELFSLTFYLLWLGAGALAGCVISLIFPEAYLLQVVVACLVALALTALTKPLTKRIRSSKGFRDAIDDLVGKQGIVLEEIGQSSMGIVKIGNETWSAKSDIPLSQGEQVIVVHRGSTILEVQKWGGI